MWIKLTRTTPPGSDKEFSQECYYAGRSILGMAQMPKAEGSLDMITCLMLSTATDFVLQTPEEIYNALGDFCLDLTKRP